MSLISKEASAPASSVTRSSRTARGTQTGCVEFAPLFQHPLLEDPPVPGAPAEIRRQYSAMIRTAENVCAACPLIAQCLFSAVVEHDVSGYAGATTSKQRLAIRRRLQISVEPEDFDTLAGVTGRHRQVDHDEVVRLRNANPTDSLETIAHRLGCSLSTVKRHLRKERSTPSIPRTTTAVRPSVAQVVAAAAEVIGAPDVRRYAA